MHNSSENGIFVVVYGVVDYSCSSSNCVVFNLSLKWMSLFLYLCALITLVIITLLLLSPVTYIVLLFIFLSIITPTRSSYGILLCENLDLFWGLILLVCIAYCSLSVLYLYTLRLVASSICSILDFYSFFRSRSVDSWWKVVYFSNEWISPFFFSFYTFIGFDF